ncbi:hypothetical protein EVAR_90619_1 [Eumeta japonica]|uniref:Uncharacterized protein n=1 Tax=Eumeta variegata TaxID=151549 RepID=A0A4C1ZSM2_EUMVA|nr:hypothetical protein EVAR_90619_1 [Eumeta japonica]
MIYGVNHSTGAVHGCLRSSKPRRTRKQKQESAMAVPSTTPLSYHRTGPVRHRKLHGRSFTIKIPELGTVRWTCAAPTRHMTMPVRTTSPSTSPRVSCRCTVYTYTLRVFCDGGSPRVDNCCTVFEFPEGQSSYKYHNGLIRPFSSPVVKNVVTTRALSGKCVTQRYRACVSCTCQDNKGIRYADMMSDVKKKSEFWKAKEKTPTAESEMSEK